jgi:hypothetical protein
MPTPVSARIEAVENERLLLKTQDGQTLSVPSSYVYGPVTVGNVVRLFIVSQSADGVGDETLSQAMINELLNPSTP